jgi:signal recognition particle subunit SEC65
MNQKEGKKPGKKLSIDEGLLERLEDTVKKLGIDVRYEQMQKPGYNGGLCRVKKSWVLIVNRSSMPLEKAELLAETLLSRDTSTIYVSPDVREIMEWAAEKRKRNEPGNSQG